MDVTIKSGKVLIDRGEVDDAVVVEGKIAELKERWDNLCSLSVERYDKICDFVHIGRGEAEWIEDIACLPYINVFTKATKTRGSSLVHRNVPRCITVVI